MEDLYFASLNFIAVLVKKNDVQLAVHSKVISRVTLGQSLFYWQY
jgi:hypothetical protein